MHSWGVLALSNPFKERDTWKGKCEVMQLRCFTLKYEFGALQNEVKVSDSFQDEAKIHGSPSTLAARVSKPEDDFKVEGK